LAARKTKNIEGVIDAFIEKSIRQQLAIDDPLAEKKTATPPPIPLMQSRTPTNPEEAILLTIQNAKERDKGYTVPFSDSKHSNIKSPQGSIAARGARYISNLTRAAHAPFIFVTAMSGLTLMLAGYAATTRPNIAYGSESAEIRKAHVYTEGMTITLDENKAFCEQTLLSGANNQTSVFDKDEISEIVDKCLVKDIFQLTGKGVWVQNDSIHAKRKTTMKTIRTKDGTLPVFNPTNKPYKITKGFQRPKTTVHLEDEEETILCEYRGKKNTEISCYRKHGATDLVVFDKRTDTTIYPITAGKVKKVVKGENPSGNYIEIIHDLGQSGEMITRYHHISNFSPQIENFYKNNRNGQVAICNSDCPIVLPHIFGGDGIGKLGGIFGINLHIEASIDGRVVDTEQLMPESKRWLADERLHHDIEWNDEVYGKALQDIAKTLKIDPTVLIRIRKREADKMSDVSKRKARGFMQVMGSDRVRKAVVNQCNEYESLSDFCHEMTWDNIKTDPIMNLWAGAYIFKSNLDMCGGNYEKAVAAYNSGIGTVYKAVDESRRRGGHWMDHMPSRVKYYTQGVLRKRIGSGKTFLAGNI